VITILNYPDAPLASLGDVNIVIPSGQERGVAQTRSFTAMYVANIAVAAIFAGREDLLEALEALIPAGEGILRDYHDTARELATDESLSQFFFLGSGPRHGLACEASLKMKEISLSICEPFHFMEFRHGPVSMVNHRTLVVGLLSEATRIHEERVLEETRNLGARTLSIAERHADISFRSGLPEPVRGVLYLPALQLMAYHRAIAAGLDPDKPHNLAAVIELDLPSIHE
jgi:glucosamine--fructose-6-phosphate aminotransferase (isomerizing)